MHSENHDPQAVPAQIVYVGTDGGLSQRIQPLLAKHGIELVCVADPDALPPDGAGHRALILDTGALGPDQTVKDLATALRKPDAAPLPLVVIARSKDLSLRLQALRAEAAAFFVAPVASAELAEKLVELCRPRTGELARVLIVEDSAVQGILAERVLKGAGFAVRILTEPLKVLEALDSFVPDLVLMDLHMPGASGDELAVVIREHDGFGLVPILFISNERDPERQADALSMGGDAFLTKPVAPEILIRTVTRRIETMRAVRQQVGVSDHRDPDTGLATRRHFMSRLERTLGDEAGHEDPGHGLLFVTIDNLSQIGEQLGAAGADLVQDRIGVMIRGQLSPADLAARLDHHCHALLIQRADADALRQTGEDLRQLVAGYPIVISGKTLSVTASIGIAALHSGPGDALALIHRARRACAEARRNGGNRVSVYGPKTQGLADEIHEERTAGLVGRALASPDGAHGFRVFYQPMVAINIEQRQYLAVQIALADRDGEPIPERDLWAAAERAGQVSEIDRWLMLHAMAALEQQIKVQPRLRFFVPQHMESLAGQGWIMWLREQIHAHGLKHSRPVLELGFHDLLNHFNVAPMLFKMLNKIAVDVCLTDVDQTAAAQDLVIDLQPHYVKISPAALRQTKPEALLKLVDRLRRGGARLIATSVDSPEQIAPIWASGINYAQGAVIQAPLHEPVFDWSEVVLG